MGDFVQKRYPFVALLERVEMEDTADDGSVRVCVRVRPLVAIETEKKCNAVIGILFVLILLLLSQ